MAKHKKHAKREKNGMLDAAMRPRLDDDKLDERLEELRVALVLAQHACLDRDFPVVLLLMADDRLAANDLVNSLAEWMDSRFLQIHVFERPSDEESERPRFWRYWRDLPPDGRIGVYVGAWAQALITDRLFGRLADEDAWSRRTEHIRRLEQDLVDDGALLLKFFLHVPRKVLDKRIKKAEARKSAGYWWVDETDEWILAHHAEVEDVVEEYLQDTDSRQAPWFVIDSSDQKAASLHIAENLREAVEDRLANERGEPPAPPLPSRLDGNILDTVDLTAHLSKSDYKDRLLELSGRLNELADEAERAGVTSVLMFEGQDAAGKGGSIRRVTRALDARHWKVVPIAAPTEEERARHWLWRFWRHLPRAGKVLIFDRSWYGRVLVERVEGFAPEPAWKRAYGEIRDFEDQLLDHGSVLCKFWLQISPEEQLRRFQAREKTPFKTFKITDEDWRNRDRWKAYEQAVHDMVSFTSTEAAPWDLVSSQDKRHGRIQVLETFVARLEKRLRKG